LEWDLFIRSWILALSGEQSTVCPLDGSSHEAALKATAAGIVELCHEGRPMKPRAAVSRKMLYEKWGRDGIAIA
jgi:hypothetical protein